MRWGYVFELFLADENLFNESTLSAVLITDKMDPSCSLVSRIAPLYRHFIDNGYTALGMYLKCIQYLTEAFSDSTITFEKRIEQVWYVKTFFSEWNKNKTDPSQFITDETFADLNCLCDGFVLYALLLQAEFSDQEFLPNLLTSDPCELAFAFIRIGRFLGRRTNVDAICLARGLEVRNRKYELSACTPAGPQEFAHTRGTTVYRKTVLLFNEILLKESDTMSEIVTKGASINEQLVRHAMKNGTRRCITECKELSLNFFVNAEPDHRVNFPERVPVNAPRISFCEIVKFHWLEPELDSDFSEDEYLSYEDNCEPNDPEAEALISTSRGKMDIRRAERVFLNFGGLSISTKSRKYRVKGGKSRLS